MTRNRYWTLADAPVLSGQKADAFVLKQGPVPKAGLGQALTRTIYVSLDPHQLYYLRERTAQAGAPCHARTVSQVVESQMDGFAVGDFVFNTNGWSEYALMGEGIWRPDYMIPRKLDPSLGRISQAVGVLGSLGLTAYAGMTVMASPKRGETVVVSVASGGVGQIAGRLAKQRGARVVGIAGRDEKCRFVAEKLGFDACVSHLSPSLPADLAAVCPDGVDVYFENVGGKVFEAVMRLFNKGERMTICSLIAHYNDEDGGAYRRAALMKLGDPIFKARSVTVKNLSVRDFVADYENEMLAYVAPLIAAGKMKYREDIRQGLTTIPAAFAEMLRGDNFGKMLVQVSPDQTLGRQFAARRRR
ncbi:NADP-dependent oxidoreductase [Bradyrhizobium sp. Arg816]|uniref:MDR family NADP-dependent oxidoreductase n=1 Tax=Bradyrhizobium sp. Arg816 TaxID=2998491 RepID=UPI00249F3BF0|nr:NADP-dependent oxidoreductase [Bradyrhizobium sp. Arg816]MDI3567587.1 NADP-dependent oxidoreductase [Bradyrhizobium sp. Arg816]